MCLLNKTFHADNNYKDYRNWVIINCKGHKVGRLAPFIVTLLQGKSQIDYSPSINNGYYVILINADSIIVNKNNKHYIVNKPGRPGRSLKIKNVIDSLPKLTIERAVKGMLSKTKTKKLITRLHIYNTEKHPHSLKNLIHLRFGSIDFLSSGSSYFPTNSGK